MGCIWRSRGEFQLNANRLKYWRNLKFFAFLVILGRREHALAYIYYEENTGSCSQNIKVPRIAANITKLPELLTAPRSDRIIGTDLAATGKYGRRAI
jgi:hypothetical protein